MHSNVDRNKLKLSLVLTQFIITANSCPRLSAILRANRVVSVELVGYMISSSRSHCACGLHSAIGWTISCRLDCTPLRLELPLILAPKNFVLKYRFVPRLR